MSPGEGLGGRVPGREWGGVVVLCGGVHLVAAGRGSKAPGSKYLPHILSAVDAHTGRFLFEHVICGAARREGRTVLFVTHQLQYLQRPEIGRIFLLEDGSVQETSWCEMKERGLPTFVVENGQSSSSSGAGASSGRNSRASSMDADVDDALETTPKKAVSELDEGRGRSRSTSREEDRWGTADVDEESVHPLSRSAGRGAESSSSAPDKSKRGSRGRRSSTSSSSRRGSKSEHDSTPPSGGGADARRPSLNSSAVARRAGTTSSNEEVPPSTSDYLLSVERRELLRSAQSHPVLLSEAVEQVGRVLATMEGHRVTERLIEQISTLLLGSEEETRFGGDISGRDFRLYLKAFGTTRSNTCLLALLIANAIFSVLGPVWLSHWANATAGDGPAPAPSGDSDSLLERANEEPSYFDTILFDKAVSPWSSSVDLSHDVAVLDSAAGATTPRLFLGGAPSSSPMVMSSDQMTANHRSPMFYLTIYVVINFLAALISAVQTVVLTICSLRASKIFHDRMLAKLVGAPMTFFDVTPTGRILNRFLQDMQNVDNYVPSVIIDMVGQTITMGTQFALIIVYCPYVLALVPVLVIPYAFIFKKIRRPARDTRRIEAVAHSPVYAHFVDSLRGLDVIRAMGRERDFIRANAHLVAQMAKGKYWNEAICKW